MPISFEGQLFEFQDLVTHLKTKRKDIENPEAFVGSLEKEQGVSINDRFYEDESGKWGKFFLISPARNVNKWRVTRKSIPKRIRTFENRPFISEPRLEHFGAENMSSPLEIIKKQDEFRAGLIKQIQYNEKDEEGFALVLFDNTDFGQRIWQDLKNGNAFYVSPAIAGEFVEVNGERIYSDWFGLHLARVANPAYGVFHASIKATCEGDEKKCIDNLIATASAMLESNDSFKFTGFTCSKNMSTETKPEDSTKSDLAAQVAAMAAELKEFKEKVETSFEQLPNTTSEPTPKGQTEPVKDNIGGEKQAQASKDAASAAANDEEMKKLKESAQAAENDLRERLTEDVLETESAESDLMGETKTAADEEKRRAELSSMDIASLKATSTAATASLNKMSALASKMGKTSVASNFTKQRVIRQPTSTGVATASSNSYKNSKDIKGGWAN